MLNQKKMNKVIFVLLLPVTVIWLSCKRKPTIIDQCNCSTGVSTFSKTDIRQMLNNIVDSDLFLVYKGIIPSNIPSIDLSVSSKYYFNYKSGEIILRIKCDCDSSYFLGASSLVHIKSPAL